MHSLVIAEKPSSCQKIAFALADGPVKREVKRGIAYFAFSRGGKSVCVAPAVGHLYGLAEKKKSWAYPVFDVEWQPSSEMSKDSAYTKAYLQNIKDLAKGAETIYLATDYDIEGEVIGANVLEFACKAKSGRRMKFSTLTKPELVAAFDNARASLDKGMVAAGRTRHMLDYFWGISVSRALMSAMRRAGRFQVMSVGRVQGPTLAVLAKREKEIAAFVSKPYWEVYADIKDVAFGHCHGRFDDGSAADDAVSKSGKAGVVTGVRRSKYHQMPPFPFDLTTLQTEAYSAFGFTPTQTLQLAQNLYEQSYCLAGDSLVISPDGDILTIAEVVRARKPLICGHSSALKSSTAVISDWQKPASPAFVKKVTLETGDYLSATADHPFMCLTRDGLRWVKAGELRAGDFVAVPDRLSVRRRKSASSIFELLFRLPAADKRKIRVLLNDSAKAGLRNLLKAAGIKPRHLTAKTGWKYATVHKHLHLGRVPLDLIEAFVSDGLISIEWLDASVIGYLFAAPAAKPLLLPNKITAKLAYFAGIVAADGHVSSNHIAIAPAEKFLPALEEIAGALGLRLNRGKSAITVSSAILAKVLPLLGSPQGKKCDSIDFPSIVLTQPDDVVAAFVAGFFDGDGSVKLKQTGSGKSFSVRVAFTSCSEEFLKKLKLVLLTFGVSSYLYRSPSKRAWDLLVYSDDFGAFADSFGAHIRVRRGDFELALSNHFSKKTFGHSSKLVPISKELLQSAGLHASEIPNAFGHGTRTQKQVLAGLRATSPLIGALAFGDVKWSPVKDIVDSPSDGFVYDVTNSLGNFVANGIVVHNCSYPRTSSQQLSEKLGLPEIIGKLSENPSYTSLAEKLLGAKRFTPHNGKNTDPAHPAIYPTGVMPVGLTPQQARLYDLIARRFLACFALPSLRERMRVDARLGSEDYSVTGSRTLEKQWLEYYGQFVKLDEVTLPEFVEGEKVEAKKVWSEEKATQPPKRFTQASIVRKLEVEKLGTKATRASIVQTLFDRGYLAGKSIEVTPLGLSVYDALARDVPDIVSEELTRHFEEDMEKITDGSKADSDVVGEGKAKLVELLDKFKLKEQEVGRSLLGAFNITQHEKNVVGECKCGGKLVIRTSKYGQFVGCSNYPDCRNTYPLPHEAKVGSTGKKCEKCGTPIVLVKRKGKRPWRMCLSTTCETKASWANKDVKAVAAPKPVKK